MGLTKPRAAQIFNLDYKQSTRVATVANVTLTGGAPTPVDGVNVSVGDRVLVTGQSTASQNGLYQVATVGSGANGTWVRTSDGNETGEIEAGMIVMVTEGTEYGDTQWKLTTNDPIVLGTTALTFVFNVQTSTISSGTSNVVVNANANVTISSAGTANVLTVSNTGAFVSGVISATGNVTAGNVSATNHTGTAVSVTGNVTGGNILTGGLISSTGTITSVANVTGGNLTTAGVVTATGNITGNNIVGNSAFINGDITGNTITATGNIELEARGILLLGDTDSSNYIGLRAPATLTGNFIFVFPTGYGNASQVLTTNGAGTLSWEDGGGGGGSGATQFPNSTVSPVPGSTGNFDLSFNFIQTSQETPFEAGGADAFGVNLGEVYSMMDPVGEVLDPVDLGIIV